MKKPILTFAILATLPLTAMAENISGAMYVAPTAATQNNPAPTTNAYAPYGRIDIDTADQQHVASTAYVKGAYNSAIAAVNKTADSLTNLINDRQYKLTSNDNGDEIESNIVIFSDLGNDLVSLSGDDEFDAVYQGITQESGSENLDNALMSAGSTVRMIYEAGQQIQQTKQNQLTTTVNNTSQNISSTVAQTVNTTTPSATTLVSEAAIASAINGVATDLSTNYATTTALNNKRVEIYTTWDNDNAKTEVAFVNASAQGQ